MTSNLPKRVAVTGLGIITSIGESIPSFREALFNGKCGIGPLSLFDTDGFPARSAAQVKKENLKADFEPGEVKRISRCDLLGLIAAREAISDCRIDIEKYNSKNMGVVLGAGAGGMLSWEKYRRALWSKITKASPSALLFSSSCALTDLIASRYRLTGTRATISTACSSSANAIGYGFDLVSSGIHDVVITGGSESISEVTFAGFNSLRLVDPLYCRPFDKNRNGLTLGEGAAILMLEEYEHAEKRGATIHAEILGYATNSDAFHMTSPDPDAKGMTRVMEKALEASTINPDQVDYINAHGTGTRINDKTETLAIKKVFGEAGAKKLAVSATKSMVGHCLGAGGAIEAVATVLALNAQIIPPTIHLENADPDCDLDYVQKVSRPGKINIALSNSFAFGGNNTALVFQRVQGQEKTQKV